MGASLLAVAKSIYYYHWQVLAVTLIAEQGTWPYLPCADWALVSIMYM